MNRNDFIDHSGFKEKIKHPNIAIGQRWKADGTHDFGHGPIPFSLRIIMREPLSDKWVVQYLILTGGNIPNGISNISLLTEQQIKDNFEYIVPSPPPATNIRDIANPSGSIAIFGHEFFNAFN